MIESGLAAAVIAKIRVSGLSGRELRQRAMELVSDLPKYDWSGIYRLEKDELVLDAFVGAETDHDRIPVGRGVCGTAVLENKNQVVADVRLLENYLSCSTETRSEIVVLIHDGRGNILGQIDIDGHQVGAFDSTDEQLLEELAIFLAEKWV